MSQPPLNPDALAQLIMWEELPFGGNPDNYIRLDANAAHAVIELLKPHLAAALPEVTSVEELEALPEGTILRDSYGLALHKRTANWWVTNCDSNLTSEDLADEIADTAHTYTVLYRPEVKP